MTSAQTIQFDRWFITMNKQKNAFIYQGLDTPDLSTGVNMLGSLLSGTRGEQSLILTVVLTVATLGCRAHIQMSALANSNLKGKFCLNINSQKIMSCRKI